MIEKFLWAIFGNDEEPTPPDWYYERHVPKWFPDMLVRIFWLFVRNPLHNFTWHVIGFVGEPGYEVEGRYPMHVWNPNEGWNWTYRRKTHKLIGFPFVSYRDKRIEFYFGWRERGNIGAAIRRAYA